MIQNNIFPTISWQSEITLLKGYWLLSEQLLKSSLNKDAFKAIAIPNSIITPSSGRSVQSQKCNHIF